ncbi:MAG: DUF2723 domain-containing protein [Bacteroidota bacterium]
MKRLLALEKQIPVFCAVLAGIVYLTTMAPSITHTDSGELAAVATTSGIAHPTGYPLWTMLGRLFTLVPGVRPAWMLNFMCLLFVSGGVYLFGRSLALIFGSFRTRIKGESPNLVSRVDLGRIFATLIGSLLFAFARTVWAQSAELEVYSLHILLLNLAIFLLLKAWFAPPESERPWLIFALGLALAFANHLTSVVLLPGIAWLYFSKHGFRRAGFIRLAKMLGLFFPALFLLYAYLPIRAGMDPAYNWGNPQGFAEIWHHVSGRQFRIWWFTGSEAFALNLRAFFVRIPFEFAFGGLLLAGIGLYYGLTIRRKLTLFFAISFLANLLYTSNYAIKDLEPYYLLALLCVAAWAAFGVRWVWIKLKIKRPTRFAVTGAAGLIVLLAIGLNHRPNNQRASHQFEDYTRAALNSLPPNSLVISQMWDVFVSPAYYLQGVEEVRPDVEIFEYAIMRNRHWYPNFIRDNYPEVTQRLGKRLDEWEGAIQAFDLGGVEDPRRLGRAFQTLCFALFEEMQRRPVYISPEIPGVGMPVPPGLSYVPEQYFYRVIPANQSERYIDVPVPRDEIRLPPYKDEPDETENLRRMLAQIYASRGKYEQQFGKLDKARQYEQKLEALGFPAPSSASQ